MSNPSHHHLPLLLVLLLLPLVSPYLLLLDAALEPGALIFDAALPSRPSAAAPRIYELDARKSPPFVHDLVGVGRRSGLLRLLQKPDATGVYHPDFFTLHVESRAAGSGGADLDYYSLPLRVFVVGKEEEEENGNGRSYERRRRRRDVSWEIEGSGRNETGNRRDETRETRTGRGKTRERRNAPQKHGNALKESGNARTRRNAGHFGRRRPSTKERIGEARTRVGVTYAAFAIPTAGGRWEKVCLRRSQYVNSVGDFLPETVRRHCDVRYGEVDDERFEVERGQGHLVAKRDVCVVEPMWKVTIHFSVTCRNVSLLNADHRLDIVYHHQEFDDADDIEKRVRRELRNRSPFFEQHLYVASVLEECDPPLTVTTSLRARDPENAPVTYSMTSLLDSRTQSMFEIEQKTGAVSTKVRLDRELVDVHYFRVTAVDGNFPPRSGTTMLQINVLDANDHHPAFEMSEYDSSIRENANIGTTIVSIKATDQDVGKNGEIEYSIRSIVGGGVSAESEDQNTFKIDPKTGVVTTRTLLDRETTEVYTLIVQATDLAPVAAARRTSSATLVVRVLDDNDNYPQFSERTYSISLNEDLNYNENPVVAQIRASDADSGANAAIRYAVISGNTQSQFAVDTLTGDLTLVKPLDYETIHNYRLVIRAQDGGAPPRSNTTQLLIQVKDVNDNAPRFYATMFQESVPENVPSGYSIVKVQAYDADEGANSEIAYVLGGRDASGGSTEDAPLVVDSRTGWIYTTRELDREQRSKYLFQVIATDHGVPPLSATASVMITVQDINDNDPVFEPKLYESVVAEDDPPGTPVATVTATDPDEDGRLHYELTNGNTRGRFAVTSQNGRGLITVAQPLDYKQEKRYVLTVTATDSGGRTDTATIYVNITDANNYAPVFENAPYTTSAFEDVAVGTTVLVVSATDNDVGANAQISYFLGGDGDGDEDPAAAFSINRQTGAVVTAKPLDREKISGYLLTVTARDGGSPSLSDTTDVEIAVTDVNDNYPMFEQAAYAGGVPEDALVGTSVVRVTATDADVGLNGKIQYALGEKERDDGSFVIDPNGGVIRTNKGLDRESAAFYNLEVIAVDKGSPSLSTTVQVSIKIDDINDSPPEFASEKIVLYVSENSPIGSTAGEIYARDPDEGVNALVQYSIIGGEDAQSFSLITRPGTEKAELITMIELDYESAKKKYDLIVRAASPPLRSDAHVEIVVTDVNDNAPVLRDFQVVLNNFKDRFPTGFVGKIPAYDADVTDKLSYRILSGNNANLVAVEEATGRLQLSPQLNTNVPKTAAMEVSVTDGVNVVKKIMTLIVRLITDDMLANSITVRVNRMTKEAFLSPLLGYFVDGLAAIIPCPKENVFVFSVQDDTDVTTKVLNVSFSVRRPDSTSREIYYEPQFLREKLYLNRIVLARLSTVQILPFDDNLCVREPCLNYEECLTVLKFGNASNFIASDTVLFRPIYPVTTFTCVCPRGFTGSKEHYLCDTEVNLCYSSPCKNDGKCEIKEGGYTCVCADGFSGENCEIAITTEESKSKSCAVGGEKYACDDCAAVPAQLPERFAPKCDSNSRSFSGNSFMTFPGLKHRHRLRFGMKFATRRRDGLLLYNGRYNEQHDFVALEIVDGAVRFSFSLGGEASQAATAKVPDGVSDGEWHRVDVTYFNKTAIVSLDGCDVALALKRGAALGGKWNCAGRVVHDLEPRCAALTETCHRFLDLTGPLQLGGVPDGSGAFRIDNFHFEGCIADFRIDHRAVSFDGDFTTDNGTAPGCPEKRDFCAARPCKNGAPCADSWNTFRCECPQGYGGKDCSETITAPWHFTGDGTLSFNPLLRPIQLPWLNALSIRTLREDAFLMSVQVGQNSSATISLNRGLLVYTYDGDALSPPPAKYVSDGEWHRLEVTWIGAAAEVKLSVDYDETTVVVPFPEKIQGLYVGKIVIGGPDAAGGASAALYDYLEGCVQDVRVGNRQTLLNRPTARENVEDGCYSSADCAASDCPSPASRCVASWGRTRCECLAGRVGPLCAPVCAENPCANGGACLENSRAAKGYECDCAAEFGGEYCDEERSRPCPASWWGRPVCGPCACDVEAGYDPDCDKKTGRCRCRENYYRPGGGGSGARCFPCDCYHAGSIGTQCDRETGQCRCKEGVIGPKCDSCPNAYAEVTARGCEVVYDGCPKSSARGIWWPRTTFGADAIEACPKGAHGRAARTCDNESGGWRPPDLFNCTSDRFVELRKQLSNIEKGDLQLGTFVAIKLAYDLHRATNLTGDLYGADVLIAFELLENLFEYESKMSGLNLTHSQDKDYISNIVESLSVVIRRKYDDHWRGVRKLTGGKGPEKLIEFIEKYIDILAGSQHDTYTSPFEIVSPNLVLGLDVVTPESLFGFETDSPGGPPLSKPPHNFTSGSVVLPDTSLFLEESRNLHPEQYVAFPKYNNYLRHPGKFDPHTKILLSLALLGIKPIEFGEITTKNSLPEDGAVVSYAHYRLEGAVLPPNYDDSVLRRWGVDLTVGSALISVGVLVPEYIQTERTKRTQTKELKSAEYWEGGRGRVKREFSGVKMSEKKLVYRSLTGMQLQHPARFRIWLDTEKTRVNPRSNPQCVRWTRIRGFGEWSRVGCRTEIADDWYDDVSTPPSSSLPLLLVNCSCNRLGTFAVLVDVVDAEYVPEPTLLENVTSYACFLLALPLLLAAYLVLALIRGSATNSNAIRKNLVLCVFLGETLYFLALKLRKPMIGNEFACKLTAIALHYLWLASFSWMTVDAVHLYRMLTEMRDVNHGPMRFYYASGYVAPAIVVAMAVGVRAHQYGNYLFCWVSLYESVVWSLVGPICLLVLVNVVVLGFAVRAAFTIQDHVLGFGNLRTLLWVSVIALPLLGGAWVAAILAASEKHALLTPLLSVAVLVHALFSMGGYCFANNRVRRNLVRCVMRCAGKKVPLLDAQSAIGAPSTSSQNVNVQTRSALAYHSTEGGRRNVGISTSSTTSRSTTKTTSSPYRSDSHLRHTSTSTSNYNSTSDVLPAGYGVGARGEGRGRRRGEAPEEGEGGRGHGDSDSDSEASEGRSLDLASSHSSDDEESSGRRQRTRGGGGQANARQGYLPNITEHVASRCGTPPSLNVVMNSQLFPAVQTEFGPSTRWSSQLPDSYLPNHNVTEVGRWSAETGSDNEFYPKKTGSPNPLPHPTETTDVQGQLRTPSEHYMVRVPPHHYDNYEPPPHHRHPYKGGGNYVTNVMSPHHRHNIDYSDYSGGGERRADLEEKYQVNCDKYHFPYTAEEDHVAAAHNVLRSPINDVNNPGMAEYHAVVGGGGGGSVCGSSVRSCPSPLGPPHPAAVRMQQHHHQYQQRHRHVESPHQMEEKNEETSV